MSLATGFVHLPRVAGWSDESIGTERKEVLCREVYQIRFESDIRQVDRCVRDILPFVGKRLFCGVLSVDFGKRYCHAPSPGRTGFPVNLSRNSKEYRLRSAGYSDMWWRGIPSEPRTDAFTEQPGREFFTGYFVARRQIH